MIWLKVMVAVPVTGKILSGREICQRDLYLMVNLNWCISCNRTRIMEFWLKGCSSKCLVAYKKDWFSCIFPQGHGYGSSACDWQNTKWKGNLPKEPAFDGEFKLVYLL
ncbi:uncharacterized protein LOC125047727 [Penaeus chinensis]|uniref:uncharacterized protein LOC125047727 n=1 Tax=Penaeus chinensis TaxID=139456 RepID=UPI001FB69711|nr:uncharacterized protein LOC125047727 [Penaeus chinensis]